MSFRGRAAICIATVGQCHPTPTLHPLARAQDAGELQYSAALTFCLGSVRRLNCPHGPLPRARMLMDGPRAPAFRGRPVPEAKHVSRCILGPLDALRHCRVYAARNVLAVAARPIPLAPRSASCGFTLCLCSRLCRHGSTRSWSSRAPPCLFPLLRRTSTRKALLAGRAAALLWTQHPQEIGGGREPLTSRSVSAIL